MRKYYFVTLILAVLFSLSCFPVYGQTVKSYVLKKEIMTEMAEKWAEAWSTRDGKPRYDMMSEKMKRDFEEKQGRTEEGNLIYSICWSSPWVESYTVDVDEDSQSAEICYIMKTSPGDYYVMWDYIAFGYNGRTNKAEVIASNSSHLFDYDEVYEKPKESFTPLSFTYRNTDQNTITYETYNKISNAAGFMISSENIYKNKFITGLDFEQTGMDNIGKIFVVDMDMIVSYVNLPENPAKDEALKNLKTQNIDEYIRLFTEYEINAVKEKHYTLQAKVDLETEGVVSIALENDILNTNEKVELK